MAFVLMGARQAKAQEFPMYQGQGVLENNWEDWSWCTENYASTAYTYPGHPNSLQITYTGAWQGFSLESPTSFQAGYFTALSFYINGGATSGRTISVAMTVNGGTTNSVNLNNYIQGGKVAAKTWSLVTIPLSAFKLKPTDMISRFWLTEQSGAAQPAFYLDNLAWIPASSAAVTVNANNKAGTLNPLMFGVNTAIWDANLNSSTCEGLIKSAGFQAFRFPGGSESDGYHWANPSYGIDFDTFASVAAPNKGQDLITVNYGTGTPSEAAAWVKYSNVTKKYGIKYWEVGNETYGSWETDSHTSEHDPVIYAQQFAQYYAQMKAASPTILIGAPAAPGEDAYANYPAEAVTNPVTGVAHSGWTPVMLATLKGLGIQPDFLIYHRYPEFDTDCDFTLLTTNGTFVSDVESLRQMLTDYSGTVGKPTKIFCTETNCDAGVEGKQTVSLVNALFLADSFGTMLETECDSLIWWDLINGVTTGGDNSSWIYGWRQYGDEGMFSPDFTLIYPMYYVEQLLNLFGAPGDSVISAHSSYGLLSAHATKRSDGSVRLLFVNKSASTPIVASLALTGITPSSTASVYTFGIKEDNEAKNGLPQSYTTTSLTNFSANTNVTFPPYSVTVIVVKPSAAPGGIAGLSEATQK
jgi:hypothetical protein